MGLKPVARLRACYGVGVFVHVSVWPRLLTMISGPVAPGLK